MLAITGLILIAIAAVLQLTGHTGAVIWLIFLAVALACIEAAWGPFGRWYRRGGP